MLHVPRQGGGVQRSGERRVFEEEGGFGGVGPEEIKKDKFA